MRRIAIPRKERIYDHYGHGKSPPPGEKKQMQKPDGKAFINSTRGHLVLAKALGYAMDAIDQLPQERQEWSDRQDMAFLLNEVFGQFKDMVEQTVKAHTGRKLDSADHKNTDPHPISGMTGVLTPDDPVRGGR